MIDKEGSAHRLAHPKCNKTKDQTIIFDMGNVILSFDPSIACRKIACVCNLEPEEVLHRIYESELELRFEEGRISATEFAHRFRCLLDVTLSDDCLRAAWSDMFNENKAVSAIVRTLKKHGIQLILLSNTNQWHWDHVISHFPIISEIPNHILSYRVGALKPDRRIYEAALAYAKNRTSALFIDDIEANVNGARRCGIQAVQFLNARQLRDDLGQLGYPVA